MIAAIDTLKHRRCRAVLARERWLFGECRGEAVCVYLQLDDNRWIALAPDKREVCWVLVDSDEQHAHEVLGDGDQHLPLRDIGREYRLAGHSIDAIGQKKLGDRIEICLEFSNATDITAHYNLITDESSLYCTRG